MLMKYTGLLFSALFVLCFPLFSCNGQTMPQTNSLQLITSISLPGVTGRLDHLSFDRKKNILFIVALENNTVEVVDLNAQKVIHTIKNMHEPQGLAFISSNNTLFIANGGTGECAIYNTETFQQISSLQLGDDADNVRYDSTGKRIYVGYGNGGIVVIDATNFTIISDIKLSGHPESFQLDEKSKKLYVNIPERDEIAVIDLDKKIVSDRWPITKTKSNFSMSLDNINHRLFVGCRKPAKLLVIDTQTGKTISVLNTDGDVDDVFYDIGSKQIYLSCGSGHVDVFTQVDANTYKTNGNIVSRPGARTSLFIPPLHQLIVAAQAGLGNKAQLLIYNINHIP